jgi:hypothetical protein
VLRKAAALMGSAVRRRPFAAWLRPARAATCAAALATTATLFVHRGLPATPDEGLHLQYGTAALAGRFAHVDESQMAISAWNGLVARELGSGTAQPDDLTYWARVRAPSAFWPGLLAATAALWAGQLYGPAGAWIAGLVAAIEPNLLAHGGLVTTDVPFAALLLLAGWLATRFVQRPTPRRALLLGLVAGLSLAAKYTAAYGLPLIATGGIAQWLAMSSRPAARRLLFGSAIGCAATLVTLAACYGGERVPFMLRAPFRSDMFNRLLTPLDGLPMPLPFDWWEGLDWVKQADELGPGGVFLMGRLTEGGVPHYFAVATALKVPLGLLALAGASMLGPWRAAWRREPILWAALVGLGVQLSVGLNFQIGLRFFLPVFPFAIVLVGRIARWGRGGLALAATGLLASAVSTARFPATLIGYTNELIPRQQAFRWFADSNLDWGQDLIALRAFQLAPGNDRVPVNAPEVTSGLQVVSVNRLVGLAVEPERYQVLRDCGRVVDTIGTSYILFDLDAGALQRCEPP